jgi:hypothetical protein
VLIRRNAPEYRGAVFLLRQPANMPIARVAAMAGISAPRVSQIQAEIEIGQRDGPMATLLARYRPKH